MRANPILAAKIDTRKRHAAGECLALEVGLRDQDVDPSPCGVPKESNVGGRDPMAPRPRSLAFETRAAECLDDTPPPDDVSRDGHIDVARGSWRRVRIARTASDQWFAAGSTALAGPTRWRTSRPRSAGRISKEGDKASARGRSGHPQRLRRTDRRWLLPEFQGEVRSDRSIRAHRRRRTRRH